jgi:integrase
MVKLDAETQVVRINDRLKQSAVPVRVRLNGGKLGIRATLPVKLGQGKKQQDIRLGIPVSRDGFKMVEAEAHRLADLLLKGQFSWNLYVPDEKKLDQMPVAQLVQKFKDDHMKCHRISEATWVSQWQRTFNRLPQDEPLNAASILAVTLVSEPDSCSRERSCQRLQLLANYAGITIDLKPYKGRYGHHAVKPRDIPSDELIVEWRDRVPNPGWQWVYGMMATFGLRPHECFFCEFVDGYTVRVFEETKTGTRITRAILPEWSNQWNLMEVIRPQVTGHKPGDFGDRNKRQFQRYKIPFPAYNLRHAYAIRGSVMKGLPVSTMAAYMGHSVQVHTKTYHHWLSDVINEEVYRRLILNQPI